jgi:hypothetical protein
LKEEALDRTMWRARFGRGFGPVVRQTIRWTKARFAVISEIHIEHTNPMWSQCRVFES